MIPKSKITTSLLFICLPLIMLICVYTMPSYSSLWITIEFILFIWFLIYTYIGRKRSIILLLAIIPTLLGPFIATMSFQARKIIIPEECISLTGYAFAISSIISLIVYVILNVKSIISSRIGFVSIIITTILIFAFPIDKSYFSSVDIEYMGIAITTPEGSILFIARVLIVIISTIMIILNHDHEEVSR